MSAESNILLSLQKLSGGVVKNYKFENESNFTANVRAKSGYSDNKDVSFYNKWCTHWIQTFSQETSTNWIVRYTYPNMQKCHFKKVFKCQHNSFDKVKKRKRDTISSRQRNKGCDATITIIFKKINRHTIRNDPLLRQELDVHIQVSYHHTHKINVVEANSYLRMAPGTQETFLKYFEDGMTPSAARGFHEIKLECGTDKEIPAVLANAQINPTERQVKYLYYKWRKEHYREHVQATLMSTDVETKNEISVKHINEVGHQANNFTADIMDTVDDTNKTNLCEDHSEATGFHEIKLEIETDDNEISTDLAYEQFNSTERLVKHLDCKWKEEHFDGSSAVALREKVSPEFYDIMKTVVETKNKVPINTEHINEDGLNFTDEILNTVDDACGTSLCKDYSAGRGLHNVKLENETVDDDIPVVVNAQIISTEPQVKHLYCEWSEEPFGEREVALEENVTPEYYDVVLADVETKKDLPEQINKVGRQDNNSTAETINTAADANKTNLCKEHSAAVIELSEHFERINAIASDTKTVNMTNAIKKFNKTLMKITTPTDLLNYLRTSKGITVRKNIPVQQISVSRRKTNCVLTPVAKRLKAGRTSEQDKPIDRKRQ